MSNLGEIAIRHKGHIYVCLATYGELDFSQPRSYGRFIKQDGELQAVIPNEDIFLHTDRDQFMTLLLSALQSPTLPLTEFDYFLDLDNNNFFIDEDTVNGPIQGFAPDIEGIHIPIGELNERIKTAQSEVPDQSPYPGHVTIVKKTGGAKEIGYIHPRYLDFTASFPDELFLDCPARKKIVPKEEAFGPLQQTNDRYDIPFLCGLSQRMRLPTLPFDPARLCIDYDSQTVFQAGRVDVKVPGFWNLLQMTEGGLEEQIANEMDEKDKWIFRKLFFKAMGNQGGPKVHIVGEEKISPYGKDEQDL